MKILDPACRSGSILLNNIFGVDIDSQAVEVTKLSLLLKVLEDENAQSLQNQYRLFHERALPDLADNIKCGNSLIAPRLLRQPRLLPSFPRKRQSTLLSNYPDVNKAK